MEYEQVAGLRAELMAQWRLIQRVYERLGDRTEAGLETFAQRS